MVATTIMCSTVLHVFNLERLLLRLSRQFSTPSNDHFQEQLITPSLQVISAYPNTTGAEEFATKEGPITVSKDSISVT